MCYLENFTFNKVLRLVRVQSLKIALVRVRDRIRVPLHLLKPQKDRERHKTSYISKVWEPAAVPPHGLGLAQKIG